MTTNAPRIGRPPGRRDGSCIICETLPVNDLLELDALLADPLAWPTSIWGLFSPPKGGALPASYRRFGAQRAGRAWLDGHGHQGIGDNILRRHIRFDVAHVARDAADLVSVGLIAASSPVTRIPTNPTLDSGAYIRYFNSGIQMGSAAMTMLAERINKSIEEGKEPDTKLIMKLADMGAAFAKMQASLVAKGLKVGAEEDEDDAFRGDPDDLPSPRMGHSRVRTVNGERRPVHDEGPADRADYHARVAQEGGDLLD